MTGLASPEQLRSMFVRTALFTVPGVLLLGFLSGRVGQSGPDNPWFASLVKPTTFPPPATFGIVWSILYVLLGLALAHLLVARGAPLRWAAVAAFAVQMALNLAWSPTFFGAHQIRLALVVIVAMNVAAWVATYLAFRVRRVAGYLMLPYLAWIGFAALLNYQFMVANPDADGREVSGAVQTVEI